MAKEIIILDQVPGAGICFRYALWAVVPLARQVFYARAGATSEWTGASQSENTAIANGSVAELVKTQGWAAGTTIAVIKAALQADFADWQTQVNGLNKWAQYGTFWDGTTWTPGGVA